MLSSFQEAQLLKTPYSQRTDSTHVLAKIRNLSRLENLGETLRSALNSIAVVAPQWLQEIVPESWYKRYVRKFEESRLPMSETKRTELAATIGRDGFDLLDILWSSEELNWLRQIHAVEILRQVWLQQYYAPTPSRELQNLVTAAAINLVRVWDWWCGNSSWGTVPSRFAALAPE